MLPPSSFLNARTETARYCQAESHGDTAVQPTPATAKPGNDQEQGSNGPYLKPSEAVCGVLWPRGGLGKTGETREHLALAHLQSSVDYRPDHLVFHCRTLLLCMDTSILKAFNNALETMESKSHLGEGSASIERHNGLSLHSDLHVMFTVTHRSLLQAFVAEDILAVVVRKIIK